MYQKLYTIYCDKDYHFFNNEFKKFLRLKEVNIIYNSFKTFKNTKIIEIFNKILEIVLRKNFFQINLKWNRRFFKSISLINLKIIKHLNISFTSILFNQIQKIIINIFILCALFERDVYI